MLEVVKIPSKVGQQEPAFRRGAINRSPVRDVAPRANVRKALGEQPLREVERAPTEQIRRSIIGQWTLSMKLPLAIGALFATSMSVAAGTFGEAVSNFIDAAAGSKYLGLTANLAGVVVAVFGIGYTVRDYVRSTYYRIRRIQPDPMEIFSFRISKNGDGQSYLLRERVGSVERDEVGVKDKAHQHLVAKEIGRSRKQADQASHLPFLLFERGALLTAGRAEQRISNELANAALDHSEQENLREMARQAHADLERILDLRNIRTAPRRKGQTLETSVVVLAVHEEVAGRKATMLYLTTPAQLALLVLEPGKWIQAANPASISADQKTHQSWATKVQLDRLFEAAVAILLQRPDISQEMWGEHPKLLEQLLRNAHSFKKILVEEPQQSLKFLEDIMVECKRDKVLPRRELSAEEKRKYFDSWRVRPTLLTRARAMLTRVWGPKSEDAVDFINGDAIGREYRGLMARFYDDPKRIERETARLHADLRRAAIVLLRNAHALKILLGKEYSPEKAEKVLRHAQALISFLDDKSVSDTGARINNYLKWDNNPSELQLGETPRLVARPLSWFSSLGYSVLSSLGRLNHASWVEFFSLGGRKLVFTAAEASEVSEESKSSESAGSSVPAPQVSKYPSTIIPLSEASYDLRMLPYDFGSQSTAAAKEGS